MSPADPVSGVPELPFSTVEDYEFRFVGEGAANVVFEVQVRPSDGSSANIFQGASSPSESYPSREDKKKKKSNTSDRESAPGAESGDQST